MVSTAATLSQALFTYGPRFEPCSDLLLPWLIFVGMQLETHFHIGDPDVIWIKQDSRLVNDVI